MTNGLYCPACKEIYWFEGTSPPYSAMHLMDSDRHIQPVSHEAAFICPQGHEYTWAEDVHANGDGDWICRDCTAELRAQ